MKRYCQTLKLKNDKVLIDDYVRVHRNVWPEVQQGMREIGILNMQIYIHDNYFSFGFFCVSNTSIVYKRVEYLGTIQLPVDISNPPP